MVEILTTPPEGEGDDRLANVFPDGYAARHLSSLASFASTLLSPSEKQDARRLLAKFLSQSERFAGRIHYSQRRPFRKQVYPDQGYSGDCSSYATQAFYYAWDYLDGVPLLDPNGPIEYDGYGWTGTLLSTNRRHRVPLDHKFFVGDIAIFGPDAGDTRHATVCRKNGVEADAIFSSHGTESGPVPTRLRYRRDLIGVYRPVSLL